MQVTRTQYRMRPYFSFARDVTRQNLQEKLAANDIWVQRNVMLTISHVYIMDTEQNKVKDLIDLVRLPPPQK